ncbi:ABC transporter substrate-binding protein [Bradyrhizobium prioriisuperbiae]|uniref:ABC transporter substrate-binding protein n=1 Tax=Bradyrhizobium prioriisuperbiae TaxID=2854389 RepID=UPI0028E50DE3|nr:ABC transporter substrate-binding protein [Bradyrhizobium prioritasuperba]
MTTAIRSVASRSRFSRHALSVSFGLLAGLSSLPARAADQITFVSQGGAYQKAQTVAILDPAARKLGITINQDSIPDAWPVIKSQVASGTPTWDVVDVPTSYCLRGGEQGLIEKLDVSKIPNAAAMPEAYRSPYSIAYEFYSSVLAYSLKKYSSGAAPNSWADFWDVKKFPGRRALRNHPLATLEAALMADGVASDQLYPLDVDRAFKKLEEIKPAITVWWTSGAQSAQLLNDGEVDMVMAWNGRVSALASEGAKVAYTYNQGVLQSTSLCILKNAPNRETAVQFLNEAVDPLLQANLPLHIDYGPANPKAFDAGVIKADRAVQLPSGPENTRKQALMSYAWWASPAGEAAEKRWVAFMQK